MMNFLSVQRYSKTKYIIVFCCIILFILTFWYVFFIIEKENEQIKLEIDNINAYFDGTFQVYKIPPWIERAAMQTDVSELYNINYLLQTDEDTKKTMKNWNGRDIPILSGLPYYPFASKRQVLKCYNKLNTEEKVNYIIVSQSIIYIGHCSEEKKKVLEEAVEFFENNTS